MRYKATVSYIIGIVLLNWLFVKLPMLHFFGQLFSPADAIVGAIYIIRDFAQREIKHYVFLAMLIGALLSYFLASQELALASMSGFVVGETIDWAVYTFTKKSLSERLLYSSSMSSPLDTLVFLAILGRLNWLSFSLMCIGKWLGVLLLWLIWKVRQNRTLSSRARMSAKT